MQYEDKVRIATPEGVELELALAGIGSRLTARLIDVLIQAVLIVIGFAIVAASISDDSLGATVSTIVGIVGGFLVIWAYDTLFESFGGGRSPGKRMTGLRVVGQSGEPESFSMAAVRNVLRPIDEYLTLWIVALVSMLRSKRGQRVGDLAAGTLVVKDRAVEAVAEPSIGIGALDGLREAESWDTSAVTQEELQAARAYLERRNSLPNDVRLRLASSLAGQLRPKVRGADENLRNERFVELLVATLARRR